MKSPIQTYSLAVCFATPVCSATPCPRPIVFKRKNTFVEIIAMNAKLKLAQTVGLVVLTVFAVMNAGCTPVATQHPLSNDKTSAVDERLFGHWRIVEPENDDDANRPRFVVGRAKDTANTLEVVFADLAHKNTVRVYRLPLFTTSIEEKRYLSVRGPNDDDLYYLVFQYEFVENNRQNREDDALRLFVMKTDVVARAIKDKQLPGKVTYYQSPRERTADNPFKSKYQYVGTTATSEQMIAFIKKHEEELFEKTRPIVLKRSRSVWR